MGQTQLEPVREHRLSGGSFFGAVQAKREQYGAIFTDLQHASPCRLPPHSHELPFFGVVLGGDYRERYGREQNEVPPFTLMCRPAGIPHQDEIGPNGVRLFQIEIRPSLQQSLAQDGRSLNVAYTDAGGGDLLWLGMKLYRETRGADPAHNPEVKKLGMDDLGGHDLSGHNLRDHNSDVHNSSDHDICVESLLAELLAAASGKPRGDSKYPPPWLRRVLEKLKVEHCQRLTLDQLSREAGVHPVHLSRVFRKNVGEGIGEHVHRLRIRTACEQMLSGEVSLAEVSMATGFADQSHFTRSFRKITGMGPSAFRMMLGERGQPASHKARQPHLAP